MTPRRLLVLIIIGKFSLITLIAIQVDYKRLPFDHCALSLQPFENPYCDDEGNVFDLVHIVPFIKRYKMNPCTGKPLNAKDLVKLKFFKTPTGEYHCPVMYKQFNNSTHIAVVRTTGLINRPQVFYAYAYTNDAHLTRTRHL